MSDLALQKKFNNELAKYPNPIEFALSFPDKLNQAIARAKSPEEANGLRAFAQMGIVYMKQALPRVVTNRQERYGLMFPTEKAYGEASAAAGRMWAATEDRKRSPGPNTADPPYLRNVMDAGFRDSRDATRCVRAGGLHPEDRRIYYEERMSDGKHLTIDGLEGVWRTLYGEVKTTGALFENEGIEFGFWALPRPLTEGWGSGTVWKRMCAELKEMPDVAFGKTDQIPGGVLAVDKKTGYEWASMPFEECQFAFGYWDPPYDHLYKKEGMEIWRTCRKLAILHTHIFPLDGYTEQYASECMR